MSASERWTRELLAELKAGRFACRAWRRFLSRSFARAREQRASRPREHRAVVALGAGGVLLWAAAAVAGKPALAIGGAAWWVAVSLMLDWHLGMLERPDGSRLDGLGQANLLTLVRAWLVPGMLALAGTEGGLLLLLLAGTTDVADGIVARRDGAVSRLGSWLDGSVDTLALGAAVLGAGVRGLLPAWAVGIVVLRLVLPWAILSVAYFARAERPGATRFVRGRLPGLFLFIGVVLAFLRLPGATELTTLGALGGIGTFALSVRRAISSPRPADAGT